MNRLARMRWRRRGVHIDVARGARLLLGDAVDIGAGTRLTVNAGTLEIGDHAHIGECCIIVVHDRVEIAPNARIEDWVSITDAEPVTADPERPVRLQGLATRPISVGEGAVVDLAANLTPGARIAARTRVAPHEVR